MNMGGYNSMDVMYTVQYQNGKGNWDTYASFGTYKEAKEKTEELNIAIEKGDDPDMIVTEPAKHCRIIQVLIMKHEMEY
jgi:hypothetical protein